MRHEEDTVPERFRLARRGAVRNRSRPLTSQSRSRSSGLPPACPLPGQCSLTSRDAPTVPHMSKYIIIKLYEVFLMISLTLLSFTVLEEHHFQSLVLAEDVTIYLYGKIILKSGSYRRSIYITKLILQFCF